MLLVRLLDHLAPSTRDLLNTLVSITNRGAGFRSLSDLWTMTTAYGRLLLSIHGGLGEFKRTLIFARPSKGRACAMRDV